MTDVLHIFRSVVGGSLSPFHFPADAFGKPQWQKPLRYIPVTATQRIYVSFDQTHPSVSVGKVQSQLVAPPLPLPAFLSLNHSVRPYQEVSGEVLLASALEYLSLSSEVVQQWYHWQDETGIVHLELYASVPLEVLSLEELRYLYYQKLLQEQVANIQANLVAMVHEVSSVKKARKIVQDEQRSLTMLSEQILEQLTIPARDTYVLSGQYTLPDVHKLIFQHLEELLLFLEQQFGTYHNTTAVVPYQRCKQVQEELIPSIHQINEVLSSSSVPAELLAVLDEPFSEIHRLLSEPVTYQQLYYLRQLVQKVAQLAQQPTSSTEEALLATLFQVNFNAPALVNYLIDDLTDKLSTTENPQEAQHLLQQAQQKYQQWAGNEEWTIQSGTIQSGTIQSGTHYPEAYRPGYLPVYKQVRCWIDDERTLRSNDAPTSTIDTLDWNQEKKVKISLTVPQIALWLRLGSEVGIFPEQDITNMCRQFSCILQSVGQKALSGESLRVKYYGYDARSIIVLKDKVIAMLNHLNRLAKEDR